MSLWNRTPRPFARPRGFTAAALFLAFLLGLLAGIGLMVYTP